MNTETAPIRWLATRPEFEHKLSGHVSEDRLDISGILEDVWPTLSTGERVLVKVALNFYHPQLLADTGPVDLTEFRALDDHCFSMLEYLLHLGTGRIIDYCFI